MPAKNSVWQATELVADGTLGSDIKVYKYPSLALWANMSPNAIFRYTGKTQPNAKGVSYAVGVFTPFPGANSFDACFDFAKFTDVNFRQVVTNTPKKNPSPGASGSGGLGFWRALWLAFWLTLINFFRGVAQVTEKIFSALFGAVALGVQAAWTGLKNAVTRNKGNFALFALVLALVLFPGVFVALFQMLRDAIMGRTRKTPDNSAE